MTTENWLGFGIGVGVGVVVLVGLTLAMKEFMGIAQNPDLPTKTKRSKAFVGFAYFLGQVVVAVAVFGKVPLVKTEMLSVGVGLVACVLVASFITRGMIK